MFRVRLSANAMQLARAKASRFSDSEAPTNRASGDVLDVLVQRALVGDAKAIQSLLGHVAPDVRRTVRGILRPGHPDLEGTVQESFIAFVKSLSDFRFESSVIHYAVRIAFRAAVAAKRRARTWRERFRLGERVEHVLDDGAASPSEDALAEERRRALERALTKLPQAQSQVLILWMVLEYSVSEIAGICAISPNTVKSRIRLGRQALHYYIERDTVLRAASGDPS